MTRVPGSTLAVMKGCSAAVEPSARIAMRHRPIPFGSVTSTAMPTRAFLPLARPSRSPGSLPADEGLVDLHRAGPRRRRRRAAAAPADQPTGHQPATLTLRSGPQVTACGPSDGDLANQAFITRTDLTLTSSSAMTHPSGIASRGRYRTRCQEGEPAQRH